MKNKQKNAVETATQKTWRTIRKHGKCILRSPGGMEFTGTPREVREAALMPEERARLADSLRFWRNFRSAEKWSAEKLREVCAEKRRDAIMMSRTSCSPASCGSSFAVDEATRIKLVAGARELLGQTLAEFVESTFSDVLEMLLDLAQSETGKREIPLTRHERAALERLESTCA